MRQPFSARLEAGGIEQPRRPSVAPRGTFAMSVSICSCGHDARFGSLVAFTTIMTSHDPISSPYLALAAAARSRSSYSRIRAF